MHCPLSSYPCGLRDRYTCGDSRTETGNCLCSSVFVSDIIVLLFWIRAEVELSMQLAYSLRRVIHNCHDWRCHSEFLVGEIITPLIRVQEERPAELRGSGEQSKNCTELMVHRRQRFCHHLWFHFRSNSAIKQWQGDQILGTYQISEMPINTIEAAFSTLSSSGHRVVLL